MLKLVNSEEIRNLEKSLIGKISPEWSLTLMEVAGSGLAEKVHEHKEPYLIICGKGNNAGDGLVAARYLNNLGSKVFVFLTSDEEEFSHDAKVNFNQIKGKVPCLKIQDEKDNNFLNALNNANTVVDCLLGTGTNKKLSPLFESIINSVNHSNKIVVACDIPTGVDPDTGRIDSKAINANVTVTFGYLKTGLMVYPGKKHAGKVQIIDIGLPDINTSQYLLDDKFLSENLPQRPNDSNKGTFGKTLLVCGSKKYPGAALLASKAAAVIGSGLTTLASTDEVFKQITAVTPEVTHVTFDLSSILEESMKSNVIVIGPGLTTEPEIEELVKNLITKVNVPIVLDADGINVLRGEKDIIKQAKKEIVLTPHPKEFAKFLGVSLDEILNNKLELVKSTAKELQCTLILKGPATIISEKGETVYISPFSNAALAKGGTGDVLSGFIGGLIAQGLEPSKAACVGVYLHGKTAELITQDKTVFSLLPQDLILYLPSAIKSFLQ